MKDSDNGILVLMLLGLGAIMIGLGIQQKAIHKRIDWIADNMPIASEVELPSSELANLTASIAALEKRIAPMEKVLVGLLKERQAAMAAVKEQPEVKGPVEAPKEDISEVPRNKEE